MPMEKHELHIRPADFFTANPALDVPGRKNESSVEIGGCCENGNGNADANGNGSGHNGEQEDPTSHMQGTRTLEVNGYGNGSNGNGSHIPGH